MESIEHIKDLLGDMEPLAPELQRFLGETKGFVMPTLRHPLIYSVPFMSQAGKMLNQCFARKREALRQAKVDRDIHGYVVLYERAWRIQAIWNFLRKVPDYGVRPGEAKEFWDAVAWAHCDSENIAQDLRRWKRLWLQATPILLPHRHLASNEKAFKALPDEIPCWHGMDANDPMDLSWTTDRCKAIWFARRFNAPNPLVLSGTVSKKDVIAYLTRRGESELVVLRQHVRDVKVVSQSSKRSSAYEQIANSLTIEGNRR